MFEQYYETDENAYWGVQSATKSVVSTLVGIALHEGLIGSLDDTLAQLLPRHGSVMSPTVAAITLRQLLTMTAGFPGGDGAPPFTRSKDWVREILTHPESPPGERFVYSNGSAPARGAAGGGHRDLGAGLRPVTAVRAAGHRYATSIPGPGTPQPRPEDWAEYENAGFAWPVDPQGVSTGWWGLKLRPQDMVKLGQLFLADGRWGNQQVVPADWVEQATTEQVPADGPDDVYGYQWWTEVDGDEALAALGFGGQVIQVVPDRNVVVVTSADVRPSDATSHGVDTALLLNVIEDDILSQLPAD